MKKIRAALILIIFLTLSLLVILILNGVRQKSLHFVSKEGMRKADIHIGDFSFFQTNKLGKEWELQAKKAELFESEKRANLENIQVTIHSESGMEISFQGEEGTIDTQRKNFHLHNKKKPILITLSNGYRIELLEVDWNNERKEISSDSPIIVYGENWIIKGKNLILKTESEEFVIQNEVEAEATS
ncbi:MAG: LPS export ABC transporter periplasmic protein LptC [Nitrospirae bacterium]|nr:LPS export ABC transporter periplasmic protein LptC [Nitrospirota bacterium]